MLLVCLAGPQLGPQLSPSSFLSYDQSTNPFRKFNVVIREHLPSHRAAMLHSLPVSETLVGVGVKDHPKVKNQGSLELCEIVSSWISVINQ